ncbi:hypothetical protein, partial [Stenotrophomonas sp. P5_B8]
VCGPVGRHGLRPRAYMDVLAACPAHPPVPAQASEGAHPRRLKMKLTLILQLPSALESPPQAKEKPKKNATHCCVALKLG